MERKLLVIANWKMNKLYVEGLVLANTVMANLQQFREKVEVVVCPPFIHLQTVSSMYKEHPNLFVGAQNCHHLESGAYTGEVTAAMIASVGVKYVIIGHSERRTYNHENAEMLLGKVHQALANDLNPVFCCGEPLEIRVSGEEKEYVRQQLEATLFKLSAESFSRITIAYEPIWAIGTGHNASPEQAQEMHSFIRSLIAEKFNAQLAEATTILYGGSCKSSNAASLFEMTDVDGALVGGASLSAEDFTQIVLARVQ